MEGLATVHRRINNDGNKEKQLQIRNDQMNE